MVTVYFDEKLKKLMRELGINQKKLSDMTGIGRPSISQYLTGKNEPTKKRRKEIARALGVPEDYFEELGDIPQGIRANVPAQMFEDAPQDVCVNVPVHIAAKLMGKSYSWVAQGLQDGVFPWGYAVKLKDWSYFISSVKFTEHTGIPVPLKNGALINNKGKLDGGCKDGIL